MKKLFVFAILLSCHFGFGQYTAIPDVNFEKALINLGIDSGTIDGSVLTTNVSGVSSLDIAANNITDLTGIQDFVSLISLECSRNKLTNLDVTKNTALTLLNCWGNNLTSLDVSKNTALTYLSCFQNQLTSLDFSKNVVLSQLYCSWNQLTSLNLKNGNNTILSTYNAWSNPNLSCIQVDNKTYSDSSWPSSAKDAIASYSEDCNSIVTPNNTAPIITATDNLLYCPLTSVNIAKTIQIVDPDDTTTDAIYIQISSGYNNLQDQLFLNNALAHPNLKAYWNVSEGKLTLKSPITGTQVSYVDFENAIKDIQYSNSSLSPTGTRDFSISINQANYLPRNGHYYEYVPSIGITWTNAKTDADAKTYYGLKGYLATITAADEAQLAGKQAPGAGWIGGSDSATEGVWKWVTGPEAGTVFWNGLVNGSSPNFAFWNTGEPNQYGGAEEDYAHITAPGVGITGSWNDLTNTGDISGNYQPKGYIVEYGGTPGDPILQISASTKLTMAQITITTPNPICASQTNTLFASSTTNSINWYDMATGGTFLHTGDNYTTPQLNSNATYFIDYGCATRKSVNVSVELIPLANTVSIPRQCDDNHDGIFTFNTSTLESTLLNGQNNITVTYFDQTNIPLKDNNGTLINSPFPASFISKSQSIQAVLTNNTTLKCSNKTTIDFIVDDLPIASTVSNSLTSACDDEPIPANQDGIFPFNTSNFESTILNGQTGMKVSYIDTNGNPLSSPLPNPFFTSTQIISVKVENALNPNCFATTTLPFIVNPLPIVKDIEIVQCDADMIVDGKTLFNLTVKNNEISSNYSNENFTYYISKNGAENAVISYLIPNELAFENTTPTTMSVWARITNKTTGCYSIAKLNLKVPATNIPPTYKIPFLAVCDDFLDTNGNNTANNNKRDGITTFDFSSTKAIIEALLPTTDVYNIKYYKNESDALAETNAIIDISNYRNVGYPNSQDIWIRIDTDLDNACFGIGPYLTLNVEALPFANPVVIPRECDDDQDGIFAFTTASLESDLLKGQTNVTVTYFDQTNTPLKDFNGVLITSPFPTSFSSTSQTIKAVVTNISTNQCYDETTIQFIVEQSPIAFPVPSSLTTTCDDETDPLEQDGQFAFDTSSFETTILGGQIGMIVEYFDQNNASLQSPLPNPFVTSAQKITAKVSNPINNICAATTILNFVVNPLPKIDLNLDGSSDELVCSNISTFFVTLDAGILDASPTTNYNYIWTNNGIKVGANTPTLDVNTEGTYTVEVINSFGCSRIRTIKIIASDIAKITSIDITELTDINTIKVNVTGLGSYQYSLDEADGFWQDSNFFNNVSAGSHIVYVNDKNGCGKVQENVMIVGAPKYFTPNNDGFNDVWEVKGLINYPLAEVTIFDRYGKLITQLKNSNRSWDGTFNGALLPATDYWYVLKLDKNSPEVKGHFSLKR
jgi:gliding motility-associated-like protein